MDLLAKADEEGVPLFRDLPPLDPLREELRAGRLLTACSTASATPGPGGGRIRDEFRPSTAGWRTPSAWRRDRGDHDRPRRALRRATMSWCRRSPSTPPPRRSLDRREPGLLRRRTPTPTCVTARDGEAGRHTPNTKAVIAVHRSARLPDRRRSEALCGPVLEDAAQPPDPPPRRPSRRASYDRPFSFFPLEDPRRAFATGARSRPATRSFADGVRVLRFHAPTHQSPTGDRLQSRPRRAPGPRSCRPAPPSRRPSPNVAAAAKPLL